MAPSRASELPGVGELMYVFNDAATADTSVDTGDPYELAMAALDAIVLELTEPPSCSVDTFVMNK